MTKKKETGVLASAKEETLNQIVKAQKEKIEALTAYGKKLKNQIKENTEKESSPISNMSLNKITQIIFLIPKIEIIDYQNFTSTTLKIQIPVILLIDNPFVKGVFHPPLV
jgi:glutamate-1-semialdehyde aminotransferase